MHSTVPTPGARPVQAPRLPVFDIPHKGIRGGLGQLSLLAGQTDYADPQAVERLCDLGRQVFRMLTLHAKDENEVIFHELDQRHSGATIYEREEHEALETLQRELEALLEEIRKTAAGGGDAGAGGARFYQLFSELHAHHLEHMLEEEREVQPLVWRHFTDEEILSHRRTIIGRNRPEDLLIILRFFVPALSRRERAGLLGGMKAGAPASFFQALMRELAGVMPEAELQRLTVGGA